MFHVLSAARCHLVPSGPELVALLDPNLLQRNLLWSKLSFYCPVKKMYLALLVFALLGEQGVDLHLLFVDVLLKL